DNVKPIPGTRRQTKMKLAWHYTTGASPPDHRVRRDPPGHVVCTKERAAGGVVLPGPALGAHRAEGVDGRGRGVHPPWDGGYPPALRRPRPYRGCLGNVPA